MARKTESTRDQQAVIRLSGVVIIIRARISGVLGTVESGVTELRISSETGLIAGAAGRAITAVVDILKVKRVTVTTFGA
jgi:hypothetical protein